MPTQKGLPENVLPHLYQIIQSLCISPAMVANKQTALQIVLSNAGITLARAGVGFLIGIAVGFVLALLMRMVVFQ